MDHKKLAYFGTLFAPKQYAWHDAPQVASPLPLTCQLHHARPNLYNLFCPIRIHSNGVYLSLSISQVYLAIFLDR